MIKMLVKIRLRFVIILNKIDKLNQTEFQKCKKNKKTLEIFATLM